MKLPWCHLLIVIASGLAIAPGATAATILLTATSQGWMTATANNGAYAANDYLAGNCGAGDCYTGEFRNFFEFGIPMLNGPVLSATLLLDTRYEAMSQSPSITYQVTAAPGGFGFSDLGAGTLYGSRTYTSADQYQVEGIDLDAAALAAIRQAAGGTFVLGGRVTSSVAFGADIPDQLIFGRTDAPQQLRIVTGYAPMLLSQSAVPEAAPALLLAGGVLVMVGLIRFKSAPRP
jgi:hypothetical protein